MELAWFRQSPSHSLDLHLLIDLHATPSKENLESVPNPSISISLQSASSKDEFQNIW